MVERRRRRKQAKLLGSHQRCWIWGRNVVLETLRAGKWPIHELHLADRLPADELAHAQSACEAAGTRCLVEPADVLERLCRSSEHQGYAAKMPPYPYDAVDDVLAQLPANPLLAVLDRVHDPHNFGAIIRSAEGLAVDAIFVAETGQSEVNSLVARSSAGAASHVRIARVPRLSALLALLKDRGVHIDAADARADTPLSDCDFTQSAAIVIGNEAVGIDDELLRLCDRRIRIPQFGSVGSLNAAVSAGILFYEASRQRQAHQAAQPLAAVPGGMQKAE